MDNKIRQYRVKLSNKGFSVKMSHFRSGNIQKHLTSCLIQNSRHSVFHFSISSSEKMHVYKISILYVIHTRYYSVFIEQKCFISLLGCYLHYEWSQRYAVFICVSYAKVYKLQQNLVNSRSSGLQIYLELSVNSSKPWFFKTNL